MATYAAYYHFTPAHSSGSSTMVHTTPAQTSSSSYSNPAGTLSLKPQEPALPKSAFPTATADSIMSDAQRVAVPQTRTINEQTDSIFFRLPAELRNKIYGELLCPDTLRLRDLRRKSKDLSVRGFNQTYTDAELHPEILSTCKKIHEEAEGLLYTTHVFHAHPSYLTSLPHLTSAAKPVLYNHLSSLISRWQISLRLDTDPRFSFTQATAAFSGAEYLEIRVWQAQFEACDYQVLKLFTGVRGVGVARVGGSVDPELARWLEGIMMQPSEQEEEEKMDVCDAEEKACPGFEGKKEIICGRCYSKVGCSEWLEKECGLCGSLV